MKTSQLAALWLGAALLVLSFAGCDHPSAGVGVAAPRPVISSRSSSPTTEPVMSLPSRLPATARPIEAPILMYHYVDASPPHAGPYSAGLTVPTARFDAQMDYLDKNGYHPVTLEQVYAAMAGMAGLPTKPVVITFDDGGLDDYTVAFPVLRAHHFTATFFVITGFVGNSKCVSWQDLRTMRAAGMDIESHTVRHPALTAISSSRLSEELLNSRMMLIQNLNETPMALAYPGGAFNQQVEAAVRNAGYLVAVTTRPGRMLDPSSSYAWPRLRVAPGLSIAGFARLVGTT